MSREQIASWLRNACPAVFRTSPKFNPKPDDDPVAADRSATAEAFDICADRMGQWANLTVARGGKPDWYEFHAILGVWRTSAKYLRGDRQHRLREQ